MIPPQFAQQVQQGQITQHDQQQYTLIAAVDLCGGFAKDGKIPWHYSEDMQWFKQQTIGHVCIMGLATYRDLEAIVNRKRAVDVAYNFQQESAPVLLEGRDCYVVSNSVQTLPYAKVIKTIYDVKQQDRSKPIFLIGGERIWREGISLAQRAIITVINKEFECDKFFPTKYLMEHFQDAQVMKASTTNDLRFITWVRQPGK